MPVSIGPDVEPCADADPPVRRAVRRWHGQPRKQNFYNQLARRMGFEAEAELVQDLYLDREHREAMAAVPLDFIDQTSLLGPTERIAERLHAFAEAGVTTLTVATSAPDLDERLEALRQVAEALDASGLAD